MFRTPIDFLSDFVKKESAAGVLLMALSAAALAVANSSLAGRYFELQQSELGGLSLIHWINDGLMAIFFLLVGLEIKREMLEGQLSTWAERALPGVAALGGMVVPALIYIACSGGDALVLRGWAIPMATDIAFALGVLALLGSRVPIALKVFLTALAIIDDLGAIVVIALFYSGELSIPHLLGSLAALAALVALNRCGVNRLTPYLLVGALLWFLVLHSGIHATLAGVALALTIPMRGRPSEDAERGPPLLRLEQALHPWVAYLIIPVFGFANAGVSFAAMSMDSLAQPVPGGIALGLLLGKPLGVLGFAWVAIAAGFARLPSGTSWASMFGVSVLCGIGFTMSLFIGALAFAAEPALADEAKLGVLVGSLASAFVGAMLIRWSVRNAAAGPG